MPIYEYACRKCNERFELIRQMAKRDAAAPCPKCASKATKRVEVQRIALLQGARPNAMAGEGEPEDFDEMSEFLGSEDDFGMGHGDDDGHDHGDLGDYWS
ncbi:MAG: zinc ribbon domain-containing protein [Chloroflexi bacterium]|nr:zinc ribbon domain-containing protein [Chloroflexota bacterium]MQC17088.1 zinc ribbon domain-containing protein [Chloroflexota bacterium]